MKPDLHIISFGVPFPAHYGGAIDVWNRIRALHAEGLKIYLHCFVYGAFHPHDAIKEVVEGVFYYPRLHLPAFMSPGQPYIVTSRKNPALLARLQQDNAPILFEGIHTTGFMDVLEGRKQLLRAHNIEHHYYSGLAKDSQRFQFLFFQREALALERYETAKVRLLDAIFPISKSDQDWFRDKAKESVFLPVFHGFTEIEIRQGRGKYLLYQGDLSIDSNQKALLELLNHIPPDSKFPILVAGKSGDRLFEQKLRGISNIQRENDVTNERMKELIQDAHIILIHSRHSAGMKVKLFPALFQGKFIVANENSITHTNLDDALHIYPHLRDVGSLLKQLWSMEFTSAHEAERRAILSRLPSDQDKAKVIIKHL